MNACFSVKSRRSNDGFLGDGSFAGGIRATELRPGRDRGTSLVTGVSETQFELLRWYFIEVNDDTGYDVTADVITRAASGVLAGPAIVAAEPRDLLADLAEVVGAESIRLADLPARLRELAPGHGSYKALNGMQLRELLEDHGVRVTNAGNVPRLDRPAGVQLSGPYSGIADKAVIPVGEKVAYVKLRGTAVAAVRFDAENTNVLLPDRLIQIMNWIVVEAIRPLAPYVLD